MNILKSGGNTNHWENEAIVVICVFADKIHSPRSAARYLWLLPEPLLESRCSFREQLGGRLHDGYVF